MPSSTSSSRPLPPVPLGLLAGALALCLLLAAGMEGVLATKGYEVTALDNEDLWLRQRARASALGGDAIVLVGASRVQLGIDTDTLRDLTGLEPVQLAIDGSSFVPVLEGLARDPAIRGTILVEYGAGPIIQAGGRDAASEFQQAYERQGPRDGRWPDFHWSEARLADALRSRMRSYADGAQPVDSLLWRVLTTQAEPQYLSTLPDRSRLADYRRVAMPEFYFRHVANGLGLDAVPRGRDDDAIEADLAARVASVPASGDGAFRRHLPRIAASVRQIEARGGRVLFIAMPLSGLVRQLDERRYPRARFFDRFLATPGLRGLDVRDDPRLSRYACPDGSHLDRRDRQAFTRDLVAALGLGGPRTGATSPPAARPPGSAAATRSP